MRITILGCGAMGSIYAALLASAGHSVVAVSSNAAHVDAINRQGLRVSGASGDRTVAIKAYTALPDAASDLLVIAVKGGSIEAAVAAAKPHVGEQCLILTMQNGLGTAEQVANQLGGERLIVGIAQGFGASCPAPGHAHHNGMKAIRMGAYATLASDQVEQVAGIFAAAGFDAAAVADIQAMQWEKLICNVAYSALAALTGMTVGEIMNDPIIGETSRQAAVEAWQVANALGVAIDVADPVQHVRDFAARMPDAKPSVLLDVQAGRRSEIDIINGAIPRCAASVCLQAPVNETLTRLVLNLEARSASLRMGCDIPGPDSE